MKDLIGYNVAIVGATGNTGAKTLQILAERKFPIADIIAIASKTSVGKEVSFKNQTLKVRQFEDVDFSNVHIAFFCAGGAFSRRHAEEVAGYGCVVIDKTSHFRLNPKVPLIIPEVNVDALRRGASLGIVSAPNCIAVPLAMSLKALSEISPIKRAVVSTYQSVSGAGKKAMEELYSQSKNIIVNTANESMSADVFQKQIAYNVIPAIGNVLASGCSDEEEKISSEVCKILKTDVKVAVTCVRVPVFIGHSMSVACEFKKNISPEAAYEAFGKFDGIVTIDRRCDAGIFATPLDVQGEDSVFISRVRIDSSVKNGLIFWVVADNLRKGAALNSVQIAEAMLQEDPSLKLFKRKI